MAGGEALNGRAIALARYIAGYVEHHDGVAPTYAECAAGIGARSKSVVARAMDTLEACGWLRQLPGRWQAIELLRPISIPRAPDGAPLHFVPVSPAGSLGRADHDTRRPAPFHAASAGSLAGVRSFHEASLSRKAQQDHG